jgi:hypothetical protein
VWFEHPGHTCGSFGSLLSELGYDSQGVGIVLISPREAIFKQSIRLKYFCTNNQVEYEAVLLGLQILSSMGVKHVEAFEDSLLVVQQIVGTFQCLDGSLNAYLDKCLEIIVFSMILLYIMFPGMRIQWWEFGFLEKLDVPACQTRQSNF